MKRKFILFHFKKILLFRFYFYFILFYFFFFLKKNLKKFQKKKKKEVKVLENSNSILQKQISELQSELSICLNHQKEIDSKNFKLSLEFEKIEKFEVLK